MLRIDGAYLYEVGASLKPINNIQEQDTRRIDVYLPFLAAKNTLSELLFNSIFSQSLRNTLHACSPLFEDLRFIAPEPGVSVTWDEVIPAWRISSIKGKFSKLEAVLTAELQTSMLYLASQKAAFDTACLTDEGERLFPPDLSTKVPQAISDVRAGARCIAFELPTAAGFHFHRANESVLRRYFDETVGESKRPKTRNMGDYITILDKENTDKRIIGALKSLKDLHRNPLMHPDESIDSIEEAISLQAAIRSAIGYMLERIGEGPHPPVIDELPLS